jgi:regulator of replication initiation timing
MNTIKTIMEETGCNKEVAQKYYSLYGVDALSRLMTDGIEICQDCGHTSETGACFYCKQD